MIAVPSALTIASARAHWRATLSDRERSQRSGWEIASAQSDRPAITVYGVIGLDDDGASGFASALRAIKAKAIDLHINSPGGFVYDGIAMYEALRSHSASVSVHIDGLAASAASFLAQSGDDIEIASAGRMMIHDAQGIAMGSPADMREYADMLDAVSDDIAGIYAARAGGKPSGWRAAMSATTWYSASESVTARLADRVAPAKSSGPDNRTRLIQARYRAARTLEGVK